jgi:hypothetical protein
MSGWLNNLANWISARGPAGAAIVAALVAFSVFLLTRIAEIIQRWIDQRAARRRVVVGLYREVQDNRLKLSSFLKDSPNPDSVRDRVKSDANLRPLLILDQTTQFFDAIVATLPDIRPRCLLVLTEFYGEMQAARAIREGLEGVAFLTISADGRASIIDDLWLVFRKAEQAAVRALYEIELAYPRRWFGHLKSSGSP